jgi:hypothetical protein
MSEVKIYHLTLPWILLGSLRYFIYCIAYWHGLVELEVGQSHPEQ